MPDSSGPRPEPTQRVARVSGEAARAAAARFSEAVASLETSLGAAAARRRRAMLEVAEHRAGRFARLHEMHANQRWAEPDHEAGCDCLGCRANRGEPDRGKRAEELLLAHLDEEQRASFNSSGQFEVVGPSKTRYRLYTLPPGPVYVLDGAFKGSNLCIQLDHHYHPYDAALARKLLIETAEREFLTTAFGLRRADSGSPVLFSDAPRVLFDGEEIPAEGLVMHIQVRYDPGAGWAVENLE